MNTPTSNPRPISIPLVIDERSGIGRTGEPVTVGIPLPMGAVFDPAQLILVNCQNQQVPVQVQVLSRWFDGSAKWVLLDFQADVEGQGSANYRMQLEDNSVERVAHCGISVSESSGFLQVNTGRAIFHIGTDTYKPFDRVVVGGVDIAEGFGGKISLVDDAGAEYQPSIANLSVETQGSMRLTLRVEGTLCASTRPAFADYVSRLSFFANSSLVEMKFMVRNPRASRHPGGLWDLGDEGSVYFKDLSIHLPLYGSGAQRVLWSARPGRPAVENLTRHLEIYQDSSGGDNWNSTNHVNRFGKIGSSFRGYRITVDRTVVGQGDRISPVLSIRGENHGISAAIEGFWQNFPKAIEAADNKIILGLFPRQFQDVYELQGGEQKTHTAWLVFEGAGDRATSLEWVYDRLVPRTTPSWYAEAQPVNYLTPREPGDERRKPVALMEELVDVAVNGANTFFDRREIIDEYGWRNFGDLYADHEAVGHKGATPLVAHYNNQYDVIQGAIIQYLRSGDARWFRLASDLAKHVIDIDIYHTNADRNAFNGGLFWHTQHYTDAATATHRTYSRTTVGDQGRFQAGGGPSNEHNYTTGLLHYYFLTGDPAGKEAVRGLADWVVNMDASSPGRLRAWDKRPQGLASSTVSWDYHGPGRGCGNSIDVLLDAYLLTRDEKYFSQADELVRRSIHPEDDIDNRGLGDVERRWSYTVFLQSLGKYLDVKTEQGSFDYMYAYASQSLLRYAGWMLDHEVPYQTVLDKVEIPTETWPAQDIRKSNVFKYAAKYSDGSLRARFLEKSDYFFERCINDLHRYRTCALTRPIVLLMTNGYLEPYFSKRKLDTPPKPQARYEFGQPRNFQQQLYELRKARQHVLRLLHLAIALGRHLQNYLHRITRGVMSQRA